MSIFEKFEILLKNNALEVLLNLFNFREVYLNFEVTAYGRFAHIYNFCHYQKKKSLFIGFWKVLKVDQ